MSNPEKLAPKLDALEFEALLELYRQRYPAERIATRREFLARFWDPRCSVNRHAILVRHSNHAASLVGSAEEQLGEQLRHFIEMAEPQDSDYLPALTPDFGICLIPSAFGATCLVHEGGPPWVVPTFEDDPAAVLACEKPDLLQGLFPMVFEYMDYFRRMAPDIPLRVPELESPLQFAGLIWKDACLLEAMALAPKAVHHLVGLITDVIVDFIKEVKRRYDNVVTINWPLVWAPNEYGISICADYLGIISPAHFEEFCLPYLSRLSEELGGIFLHCCGSFDHNIQGVARIPHLRNLDFEPQVIDWRKAIDVFSGTSVLCPKAHHPERRIWKTDEEMYEDFLRYARPDSRFVFHYARPCPGNPSTHLATVTDKRVTHYHKPMVALADVLGVRNSDVKQPIICQGVAS